MPGRVSPPPKQPVCLLFYIIVNYTMYCIIIRKDFFAGKRSNNINQVLSMPPHHLSLIFTGMKEKIGDLSFFQMGE